MVIYQKCPCPGFVAFFVRCGAAVGRRTTSSCVPARPSPSRGRARAAGRRPGRSGPGPWFFGGAPRRAVRLTTEVAFRCARTGDVPRRPRCCAARLWCLWRCPRLARCTDGLRLGPLVRAGSQPYSRAFTTLGFSFESHSSQETAHLSRETCLAPSCDGGSIPSGEADRHREDRHVHTALQGDSFARSATIRRVRWPLDTPTYRHADVRLAALRQ